MSDVTRSFAWAVSDASGWIFIHVKAKSRGLYPKPLDDRGTMTQNPRLVILCGLPGSGKDHACSTA
jgi:hypothetical protein